jgi:hypothetical protein
MKSPSVIAAVNIPIYVVCIQPNDGYLASWNMYLLLILICKNEGVFRQNIFMCIASRLNKFPWANLKVTK